MWLWAIMAGNKGNCAMPGDSDVVLADQAAAGSTHLAHGSEKGVVSNYHCACVGSFPADDFV